MDGQADINGRMRAILIDWLIEVHMKYRLRTETLFMAVSLLDRYLSLESVARRRLQLVGVVVLFIAAKFEEISPPEVGEFVYITDNAYTKDEIISMECSVLNALGFQATPPLVVHFLDRLLRASGCTASHRELAGYLTELALVEIRMIRYPPSQLAAAAMLLSNELMGLRPAWPAPLAKRARHPEVALRGCADELRALLEAAPAAALQAVRKKYMQPQHRSVARMTLAAA